MLYAPFSFKPIPFRAALPGIEFQLPLRAVHGQKYLLRAFIAAGRQLLLQPGGVMPDGLQIVCKRGAVQNQRAPKPFRLRGKLKIRRCGRAVLCSREKADLSVSFQHRRFQLAQIKIAGYPALAQKFVQVQPGTQQIFGIKFPVLIKHYRAAIEKASQCDGFTGKPVNAQSSNSVDHRGRERLPPGLQIGGQLRGNGPDGDAGYIIKQTHLADLTLAHQLTQAKQDYDGNQASDGDFSNFAIDLHNIRPFLRQDGRGILL